MLRDHKLANAAPASTPGATVQATPRNETMLAVLGLESGFETDELARHQRAGHSRRPPGAAAQGEPQARQFHLRGDEPRRRRPRRPCRPRHRPLRRPADASTSPARRMTASSCTMPATTNCSCRSRTSSCCRATAPTDARSSSTSSAASPGRRARPSSRSASATWRAS